MKNKIELPCYSVRSESTGEDMLKYKLVRGNSDREKYILIDAATKRLNSFSSLEEAMNHARYCAEASALYLRANSAIMFEASEMKNLGLKYGIPSSANYFSWNDQDYDFTQKHGFGPSASINARQVSGCQWYKVRYEYLNTEVMFPSAQAAMDSMNNFVNIDDWKVYDWCTDTFC